MSKNTKQINAKSQDDPDTMALRAIKEAITLLKDANNAVERYGEYLKITKAFQFDPNGFPETHEMTDLIQESIARAERQMDMLHCIGYYADSKDGEHAETD